MLQVTQLIRGRARIRQNLSQGASSVKAECVLQERDGWAQRD